MRSGGSLRFVLLSTEGGFRDVLAGRPVSLDWVTVTWPLKEVIVGAGKWTVVLEGTADTEVALFDDAVPVGALGEPFPAAAAQTTGGVPTPAATAQLVKQSGDDPNSGGGPAPKPDPVINGPVPQPVAAANPNSDDLDVTIPNTGINIGGDRGEGLPDRHPLLNGGRNPLAVPLNTRAIPTGTAEGANGSRYAFYSTPPSGTPPAGERNPYVTSPSLIVDLSNPAKSIGLAQVGQASGAYDPDTNRMYVVGNPGDGKGGVRELYMSAPVDPANPHAWVTQPWTNLGNVLAGDRENQLIRLQGGGFLLVGADTGQPIRAAVASTPQGLVGKIADADLVATTSDTGVFGVYGPTIVSDVWDPNTRTNTVTLRVSQYGDEALAPPPGSDAKWPYKPQLFTTTFTVTRP